MAFECVRVFHIRWAEWEGRAESHIFALSENVQQKSTSLRILPHDTYFKRGAVFQTKAELAGPLEIRPTVETLLVARNGSPGNEISLLV
jgi:hypothetical protein